MKACEIPRETSDPSFFNPFRRREDLASDLDHHAPHTAQ